jgi:hypothetical protein
MVSCADRKVHSSAGRCTIQKKALASLASTDACDPVIFDLTDHGFLGIFICSVVLSREKYPTHAAGEALSLYLRGGR